MFGFCFYFLLLNHFQNHRKQNNSFPFAALLDSTNLPKLNNPLPKLSEENGTVSPPSSGYSKSTKYHYRHIISLHPHCHCRSKIYQFWFSWYLSVGVPNTTRIDSYSSYCSRFFKIKLSIGVFIFKRWMLENIREFYMNSYFYYCYSMQTNNFFWVNKSCLLVNQFHFRVQWVIALISVIA